MPQIKRINISWCSNTQTVIALVGECIQLLVLNTDIKYLLFYVLNNILKYILREKNRVA